MIATGSNRMAGAATYSTSTAADYAILNGVPDREQLVAELAQLLKSQLKLHPTGTDIGPDEPLFGGRFSLDSVDTAQWVLTVERHFGSEIPSEALTSGGLRTLGTLADALIRSRTARK
jgi:acyl carrier protein